MPREQAQTLIDLQRAHIEANGSLVRIDGTEFDPLDEDGANARLLPEGWLYVAGQGPGRTPL